MSFRELYMYARGGSEADLDEMVKGNARDDIGLWETSVAGADIVGGRNCRAL